MDLMFIDILKADLHISVDISLFVSEYLEIYGHCKYALLEIKVKDM